MSDRTLAEQTAVCTTCEQPRPLREFLAAPRSPLGRLQKCLSCIKGAAQAERDRRESANREATKQDRARRKLSEHEQERRFGGSDEKAELQTTGHQVVVEENRDVGAGRSKERGARVLCLADGMHRVGTIDLEEWQAAKILREKVMRLLGHSEGVSSYGLNPGRANSSTKGDRKGRALTGYDVNWRTGDAELGMRHNRSDLREAADLLFAMVGVHTDEGDMVFDVQLATLLVRSVLQTTNAPTLDEIGTLHTRYGPKSKQKTAAAATILRDLYRRGALHLRLTKGSEWDDKVRWLPSGTN